ncbi:oxidoreductase, partial [candidate division KSB1 bacterium]|nr:oxidoreductase [candidate division KSB1 bacterium]
MKQVIQYQKTGEMSVAELPEPMLKSGGVLVRTAYSLISAGTEKSSVATAQASMVGKARSRPDLVKQVFANVKREGLFATYDKVQNRLDNYKELGYSAAGEVVASASDRFKPGDRVACAGVGFASHAEM